MKNRAACTAILAAVGWSAAGAQPIFQSAPHSADASTSAAALRDRGLSFGYNLDFAEAQTAFTDAIHADPSDAASYRLAAATRWIAMLFERGAVTVDDYLGEVRSDAPRALPDPASHAMFQEPLARALALSETRLNAYPADPEAHYQVGSAMGVLATSRGPPL